MARIYSSSFFHYTNEEKKLVGILGDGFIASYAKEEFKDLAGKLQHLYIPMVSFCDVPLSHIENPTVYGNFAIGMNRAWGKRKNLSPVAYYPNKKENHLHKYVANILDRLNKGGVNDTDSRKFLGYAKPFYKWKSPKGKRVNNYIDREWRKISLSDWIDADDNRSLYFDAHNGKMYQNLKLAFNTNDVSFIIVPDDKAKSSLINNIQSLQKVGGHKCNSQDLLNIVSKIITIDQIKKNF